MLALGSTLVAGAILLTALTALLFRRPNPPRWTRPDLVAMLVAVPLTGLMGLGIGYMLVGGYRLRTTADPLDLGLTAAVWLVAFAFWHLLGVRIRLRRHAASERAGRVSHPASPRGGVSLAAPASPEPPVRPHDRAAA